VSHAGCLHYDCRSELIMSSTQRGFGQSSDRHLQDQVIHYLTDAGLRSGSNDVDFLDANEAERAERFSRFLARRYYRDRLHRGFRYSARLLGSEHAAANLMETPAFDLILKSCVLGSPVTARAVGDLVLSEFEGKRSEGWWTELLQYEFAFFVQLAASEPTPASSFPQRSLSTVIREFQFSLPEIFESLRKRRVPEITRLVSTTLLFSRTHHGTIYVVQLDALACAVMHAVNGSRQPAEIAECAGASQAETNRILEDLVSIGAVLPRLNKAA